MGKSFGIILMVITVWVVAEVTTKGIDRAFGGVFADPGATAREERVPAQSVPKRAGDAVERAQREHEARYEELMPE